MSGVRISYRVGSPMAPQRRAQALAGGSGTPYDAADVAGEHMMLWRPSLWSPDAELNGHRDRIVSRVRDMVRNDGWSSGIVTRILDNTIGGTFHPVPKPDFQFLRDYTGNTGFDIDWAAAFGKAVKARYRAWAQDPGRYCDAGRRLTVPQIFAVAFRHKLIDGDSLLALPWLPKRIGPGRASYATAVELIDPDRLSNPQQQFDMRHLRGGVEIDDLGAAVAYHIRKAHQGDWWAAADAVTWERVPRETDWGRQLIVHDFESTRASQHRGGAGILTPVLQRLKMLFRYDGAELDAALLNAVFGAYIESPFDHNLVSDALGDEVSLGAYQTTRAAFHDERRLAIGDVRMPTLFPGEKIATVAAARPTSNFADFEKAVLRNAASAAGVSAQQASNDWSDVNYSSARGALLEFWKTTTRRRSDFAAGTALPVYGAWLEEAMELDDLPLPPGAPPFEECRAAYARATCLGPGLGWMDPVDEPSGAILRLDGALTTHSRELGEQGLDLDEVIEERALELRMFAEHNIPPPSWAVAEKARDASKKPEAE